MNAFRGTVLLPARNVALFKDLAFSRADANMETMYGTCVDGARHYSIRMGDPNISTTAVFTGSSGRGQYEVDSTDPFDRCQPHAGGFCTTMNEHNFREHFYTTVRGHEAVVAHNIVRETREDFWHIVWYDSHEDMSYGVELWGGVARRVGAPQTFEVLDHLPYAHGLAGIVTSFVPVSFS